MTVAELIEKLSEAEPSEKVCIIFDKTETSEVKDVLYTDLGVYIYNY